MPAVPRAENSTPAPVLQTGTYTITAVLDKVRISRSPAEDRSLLPKPVLTLPKPVTLAPWLIIRNADGTYTMKNGNAPVVEIDGQLFAQLQPGTPARETRWRITSVHWQGEDQFIIETVDKTRGWELTTTPSGQSAIPFVQPKINPLVSTRSMPPQYTTNARFIIKKAI